MATQDYVRRGQARAQVRKTNKRKTKPTTKQPVKPTPWARIIVAIGMISGFVYGLYWLQYDNGVGKEVVANSNGGTSDAQSSVEETPKKKQNSPRLPVLREEEWAFIDALPEYSVEVDVEEIPESDKTYIMQCGSFRKISQAETLKARIAFQGLESEVIESNGNNGRWFRVVLGPYDRKRLAESNRHQLRRGNI
ncbi:MAG: SPOR domain-containing protein, partial [Pseudomonadota bacterium]